MEQQTENSKKKTAMFLILGIIIGLVLGIYFGMIIEKMVITAGLIEVAEAFNGKIDINVDLNETQIMEGTKQIFQPYLEKQTENFNVLNKYQNCTPVPCECWNTGCALYCMECK